MAQQPSPKSIQHKSRALQTTAGGPDAARERNKRFEKQTKNSRGFLNYHLPL
jgi:hypothetical protein